MLTNNFTELDWFFSFNCYYLGCNYGKDITKQMFLDLDKVGYTYQVKGKSDINSCVRQCCSHETCNIAFFEGKVNIFVLCFFSPNIILCVKWEIFWWNISRDFAVSGTSLLRTSFVIEVWVLLFCSHQISKLLPHIWHISQVFHSVSGLHWLFKWTHSQTLQS